MNAIGQTLFVLAVQVSCLALVALIVSRRRSPMLASSPLAFAVLLILLWTPLAFVPRPTWSQVRTPAPATHAPSAAVAVAPEESPVGIDVLQLLRQWRPHPSAASELARGTSAWSWWARIVLGLAVLGLVRFVIAWWQVRRVVRHGTPLHDATLHELVATVCAQLRCRPVELREADLAGAATVGWWRPVILLDRGWRHWSIAQLRAVLAHEFAHVQRRDYLARFGARFVSAIHGYHPLVRWLMVRLETQQELAADALAAPVAGGPVVYAQALASLALQADGRRFTLAPSMFSRPQTLLRRIGMLRVMDGTSRPGRRWPALVAVGAMALGALGLHGRTAEAVAGPIIPVKFAESKRAPLDYTYVNAKGGDHDAGLCVVRIGELLAAPGMDALTAAYGESLKALLGDKKLPCAVNEIEQIGGRVSITHDASKPAPNRSLSVSLAFVRTTKDIDWVAYMKDFCTEWQVLKHADTPYYSGKLSLPIVPGDKAVYFYFPDQRTMVLESEATIKGYIDAKKKPVAKPEWASLWNHVEGSMMAMVLPNPKAELAPLLVPDAEVKELDKQMIVAFGAIASKAKHAVIGLDTGRECRISATFGCATADDAIAVDEACQKFMKISDAALKDAKAFVKEHPVQAMLRRGVDFGKATEHHVGLEYTIKGSLGDLFKSAMADGK